MTHERPKVSVAMVTFNHERFIVQAVESALAQQTDFAFEIVVGEDASTDRTRERLLAIAERCPDRVKLILQAANVGGHANLKQVLSRCQGEYVALLEGDDYWTDPHKLQIQADLLDRRPKVAICHHNSLAVYDDGHASPFAWHRRSPARRTTLNSLLDGNFISTCTAMFRNGLVGELPDWGGSLYAGDWRLHILNARHGRIAYIDRVMAVYRLHSGGVWWSQPRRRTLEGLIATAERMSEILTPRQQRRLNRTIARWHADIVELLLSEGDTAGAAAHAQGRLSARSLIRLNDFYRGLEREETGHPLGAAGYYLRSFVMGGGPARIGRFDLSLALLRVTCPRTYRAARSLWRQCTRAAPAP